MAPLFRRFRSARRTSSDAATRLRQHGRWVVAGTLCLGLAPVPLADDTPPDTRADDVPWYHRAAPWQAPTAATNPAAPTPWMAAPPALAAQPAGNRVPVFGTASTNPFGLASLPTPNSAPVLADLDNDGDLDLLAGGADASHFFFDNTGTPLAPAFAAALTDPFGLYDTANLNSNPALADIDNDGDLDLLTGDFGGIFFFFENTGSASAPDFSGGRQTDPFGLTDIGYQSAPTFGDVDGDGDLDVLSGQNLGNFFFFENIGTASAPAFAAVQSNPFGLTDVGYNSTPRLVDLDHDGDLDVLTGANGPNAYFFENTGTALAPAFGAQQTNPYGLTAAGSSQIVMALGDLDNDGDLDLLTGEVDANFRFANNIGPTPLDAKVPLFGTASTNPFGLASLPTSNSAPVLADLDNDGDLDLLAGGADASHFFFDNTGTPLAPAFAAALTDPFGLYDTANLNSNPALADIDNDGDLDLLTGDFGGIFFFFENIGSASAPDFSGVRQTDPFGLTDIGYQSAPTFGDVDGDGDLDVLSGQNLGNFFFFENIGTASAPAFAAVQTNPFGLTDVGYNSTPRLVDLDRDGDLDVLTGANGPNPYFFENTGTALAPAFSAQQTNPYGFTAAGSNQIVMALGDLDHDGDLDLLSGEVGANFRFAENTGPVQGPGFATALTNPFGLSTVAGNRAKSVLADLDHDGDLDVLTTNSEGNFYFFPNTGTPLDPAFGTASTNPFGLADIGGNSNLGLADIDGDGDIDVFARDFNGDFFFFPNNGTPLVPAFGTASTNPFGLSDVGDNIATVTLADIDQDGDIDLFAGSNDGVSRLFENIGTPLAPNFAAPVSDPFGLTDVGFQNNQTFVDLDQDGDLDVFTSTSGFNTYLWENTGTATAPAFVFSGANPYGLTGSSSGNFIAAFGDLDSDGDLDLLASEYNTNFRFFENTNSGAFAGTVSHSISGPEGWHFFANPITNQTYQNLFPSGVWTQGATGSNDIGRDPSLFTYNETASGSANVGYTAITDLTVAMTPGQGFITYFWEDDDPDVGGIQGGFPKVLNLTGTEQTPPFNFPLTYTDTGDSNADGWNLVGNPSLLTLDWDISFTRTNVDGTVYLWNPATSAYELWNGTTGDLTDGLIAPLQAFFVKASAAAPTMSVEGTSRTTGGVFRKGGEVPALIDLRAEGTLDGTPIARTAFFMFTDEGEAEIDALDGKQLSPLAPTTALFYSETADDHALQINHLPRPGEAPVTIPLRLEAFVEGAEVGGTFTLTWPRLADVPTGWKVELHDADTGAVIDLRREHDYTFETQVAGKGATLPTGFAAFADLASPAYAAKGASAARLSLVITNATATDTETLDLPETLTLDQNYPNPFNPTTTIRYGLREAGPVRLVVYDLLGREVARLLDGPQQAGWHEVQWSAHTLPSGVYVYRLEAEGRMLARTLLLVK